MVSADHIPVEPGVYQLVLRLPEAVTLQVGKLGTFTFRAGRYVYTGSALGGLRARIARHLRAQKRLRWHIDYLLPHTELEDIRYQVSLERLECARNREMLALPCAQVIAPGFGSSDCRCPTHLVYLADG
jgi:Uri superfamily endonuclease